MVRVESDNHVTPDDVTSPGVPELPKGWAPPAPTTTTTEGKYRATVHHLYDGEVQLEYWDRLGRRTHLYRVDGQHITGVTTALKIIDKPMLLPWACGQMEECALEDLQPFINSSYDLLSGVNSVATRMLATRPDIRPDDLQLIFNVAGADLIRILNAAGPVLGQDRLGEILAYAKGASRRTSRAAANIGSMAHHWIEDYIKFRMRGDFGHQPMPTDPKVCNSVEAFLRWENQYSVVWLSTERAVYSREERFGGMMDFEALINGKLVAGDLKTSKGIYDEYWLQTAGYWGGREEETGHQMQYDGGRLILRLDKETGEFEAQIRDDRKECERDYVAFLYALGLTDRMAALKAYSKG